VIVCQLFEKLLADCQQVFQQRLWAPHVEAGSGALTAVRDFQSSNHAQSVLLALTEASLGTLLFLE